MADDRPREYEARGGARVATPASMYYRNVGRRVVAETLTFNQDLLAVEGCSQWSALGGEG